MLIVWPLPVAHVTIGVDDSLYRIALQVEKSPLRREVLGQDDVRRAEIEPVVSKPFADLVAECLLLITEEVCTGCLALNEDGGLPAPPDSIWDLATVRHLADGDLTFDDVIQPR
jgi:hypothetical protein